MTFAPVLPSNGLIGWNILQKTVTQQKDTFASSGSAEREISNFKSNFPKISSVEDLVNDRSILKVVLGSFGLQDDLNNKFFIKKIISDGTEDRTALSNLLADSRYKDLAKSFDFSNPELMSNEFVNDIATNYISQSFETAVGAQNENFRLALNLERTLSNVGEKTTSNDAKWFTIMGSPPLRKVFEVALSLPTSFGTLPIDNQLDEFKARAESVFGTSDLAELSLEENQERITQRFLLQAQVSEISTLSAQSTALTLLQGI